MGNKGYTKSFTTAAGRSRTPLGDIKGVPVPKYAEYYESGKASGRRWAKKHKKKIRNPHAYAHAVALRRAQRTGSKPHHKLSKPRKKTRSEAFEARIDGLLHLFFD